MKFVFFPFIGKYSLPCDAEKLTWRRVGTILPGWLLCSSGRGSSAEGSGGKRERERKGEERGGDTRQLPRGLSPFPQVSRIFRTLCLGKYINPS